jgi:hypothetical protein
MRLLRAINLDHNTLLKSLITTTCSFSCHLYQFDIKYQIFRLVSDEIIFFFPPDYSSLMRMLKKTIPTQMMMMMVLIQHQNEKVKVAMMCLLKSIP